MPATKVLSGPELTERISAAVTNSVEEPAPDWVRVRPEAFLQVCRFIRDDRELDGRFLNSISGLDRFDYFEVIYHITSLSHNHTFTLKLRADHDQPEVPSAVSVWLGAHLQEREIYDLLGIRFAGHPDLKRLFLWDGFPGHPLRKDFLTMPGGEHPGLQRFPKEEPGHWGGEARVD